MRLGQEAEQHLIEVKSGRAPSEPKLTVQLILARGPFRDDKVRISLVCQQERIASLPKLAEPRADAQPEAVWNELFAFNAPDREGGPGELELAVLLQEEGHAEVAPARLFVPLEDLRDQKRHDLWLQDGPFHVHLECQWVHSQVELFRSHVLHYEAGTVEKEDELLRYMVELKRLRKPFEKKTPFSDHIVALIDTVLSLLGIRPEHTSMVAVVLAYLLGLLAVFTCFSRGNYLDLMLFVLVFYCELDDERWTLELCRGGLVLLALSFVVDGVWLAAFVLAWQGSTPLANVHAITKACSLLTPMPKLGLLAMLFKQSHQLQRGGPRTGRDARRTGRDTRPLLA